MHGLFYKALEEFIRVHHGPDVWVEICRSAGSELTEFEMLRTYDSALILRLIAKSAAEIDVRVDAMLEDIGHWICTHPPLEPVRRLVRFSGSSFVDLLYAMEELHDRAGLALPSLDLPSVRLTDCGGGRFRLLCFWEHFGGGPVLCGVLRAMADDYGILALIERTQSSDIAGQEEIIVQIFDPSYQRPREFNLGVTS